MTTYYKFIIALKLGAFLAATSFARSVDVADFKAVPDGATDNTEAIQKAIDTCSETGGGEVIFSAEGTYLTGTVFIKDGVTLYLPRGVILKGNRQNPEYKRALIRASKVQNIGIRGKGTIDGSGTEFPIVDNDHNRPQLINIRDCYNVRVDDVRMQNSAAWVFHVQESDTIFIKGIHIKSLTNFNNDGIDIEAKNVVISDCIIDSDDDAICFKTHNKNFSIENVVITNCIISSNCNFIKFGTASKAAFRNITISNCVLKKCSESNLRRWDQAKGMLKFGIKEPITGIGGVALEAVDGGFIENVAISNLTMTEVQTPVFIRVGHRNKDEQKSFIKNVKISGIVATSASLIANSITSVPGHTLENIVISDSLFTMMGGSPAEQLAEMLEKGVPEAIANYPENRMFGCNLPAYGFYIRHAANITLDNVQMRFLNDDYRPAITADDVDGLRLLNCIWQKPKGEAELLKTVDVKNLLQQNNIVVGN